MSFDVRLMRGGSVLYTFGSHPPLLDPVHTREYTDQQPAKLAAVNKVWTIEGVLYGTSETTASQAWTTLTGIVENPNAQPDAVQLVRNPGGVVVDSISSPTYRSFKVELVGAPRIEGKWRDRVAFTVRISGRRVFTGAFTSPHIVDLKIDEIWSYAESGLLTITLSGEIEVENGISAVAIARTLGLTLPGPTYGFMTKGPEGVDVEQLDNDDTKARFTSTIQESGAGLPQGVAPTFSTSVSVEKKSGELITTTVATAVGPGAVAAVAAQRPKSNVYSEKQTSDPWRRTASAVYVQKKTDGPKRLLRTHRFTIRGGGKPVRWSKRTGDKEPAPHALARTPAQITEDILVEQIGKAPGISSYGFPAALGGVAVEDKDARAFDPWPTKVEIGGTPDSDKWVAGLRRVYTAASIEAVIDAIAKSSVEDDQSENPFTEASR